jgi:hypothetical protein
LDTTFFESIQNYIAGFNEQLPKLSEDIQILQPYRNQEAQKLSRLFYNKYYTDQHKRFLILGINPGRHGAGITGIPFTDTKRLKEYCQIISESQTHEISSEFIYRMIETYGGATNFYSNFFISSVSPVGFTRNQKNYNYYDDARINLQLTDYLIHQMNRLLQLPLETDKVICLGEGKNYQYLCKLNYQFNWFKEIIPLPHPRYIMQYKRPQVKSHIDLYINILKSL